MIGKLQTSRRFVSSSNMYLDVAVGVTVREDVHPLVPHLLDQVLQFHRHVDDPLDRRLVAAGELDQGHQARLQRKLRLDQSQLSIVTALDQSQLSILTTALDQSQLSIAAALDQSQLSITTALE